MKQQHGFIAITSILIISILVFFIGTSLSLLSVAQTQTALGSNQSLVTLNLVEACIEEALLRINEDDALDTSIALPEGTCSVTINSHVGNDWVFTTSYTSQVNTHTIEVSATRDQSVTITNWQEL